MPLHGGPPSLGLVSLPACISHESADDRVIPTMLLAFSRASSSLEKIRLIGLLQVFASQKIVHNVRDEMAELVVPVKKDTKNSLTRQGM